MQIKRRLHVSRHDIRQELIKKLLLSIEEEDIGISLMSTFYQIDDELRFFSEEDRGKVLKVFKDLSEDSKQHKKILERIISHLGRESHAL